MRPPIAGLLASLLLPMLHACSGGSDAAPSTAPEATHPGKASPDFSGTWERFPDPYAVFNDNPFAEEPPPPNGGPQLKEPYASEYQTLTERKAAAMKAGKPLADPSTQCRPEGVPTLMGAIYPIEIVQTPQQLVVLTEFLTQTRRIYLNEKMPPLDDISPSYTGHSVAHWEGQTLVVQTLGVREDVRFVDIPHSAQMTVTERIRLTGPDLLENEITIDDPAFLARPYRFTFGYRRNPDYRIMEYICDNNRNKFDAEGNVSLEVAPK
ncbi:MAG: hypothetical protein SXG53_12615 [Pseudomonadota bacterium]|nr:hypothetical protein [Pseudomonadota bacterium]